jgi:hypothetical protein
MLSQEPGRPHARAITQLTRVSIDDFVNEQVNEAERGAWPPAPR